MAAAKTGIPSRRSDWLAGRWELRFVCTSDSTEALETSKGHFSVPQSLIFLRFPTTSFRPPRRRRPRRSCRPCSWPSAPPRRPCWRGRPSHPWASSPASRWACPQSSWRLFAKGGSAGINNSAPLAGAVSSVSSGGSFPRVGVFPAVDSLGTGSGRGRGRQKGVLRSEEENHLTLATSRLLSSSSFLTFFKPSGRIGSGASERASWPEKLPSCGDVPDFQLWMPFIS